MAFNDFLDLTKLHPNVLSAEILVKISTFLLYAPRFKNDILLAQESNWPSEIAPWILPESVMILLSNLCEINNGNVEDLWTYLKDIVWKHDEKTKEVETRLKLYGKALGYGTLCSLPHNIHNLIKKYVLSLHLSALFLLPKQ